MRHRLLFLTLVALGCGPGDDTTATTGTAATGTTADTNTTAATDGSTTATDGSTTGTTGTTGAPTTSTGTTGVTPDGKCRTQADCMAIEQCEPPGSVQCGGATGCTIEGQECIDDAACNGTPESPQICVPDPCCGLTLCRAGCLADSDCGLAQTCAEARCTAANCDPETPCPADFTCTANTCAAASCTDDDGCDGYCVNGLCSAQLGTCVAPAP